MAVPTSWEISGSYFEACNCLAICPCRSVNGGPGRPSTYGVCQFALSWQIVEGDADGRSLADRAVVLAGWFDDHDEAADHPWSVSLYVDERCDDRQHDALAAIFLGRAGGSVFTNYGRAIGTVHHVRAARIDLSHERRRWHIRADRYVTVSAGREVGPAGGVSCGIPGHDRPGQELVSDELRVEDTPLVWDLRERCGFATDFRYTS